MLVLILPFSSNAVGRTAALFEHSLVVCLSAALQRSLGADCLDMYPEPGEGRVLTLTRTVEEEDARECAEKAGADCFLWGDLHYLPEGKRLIEKVFVALRMGAGKEGEGSAARDYRFAGFVTGAKGAQRVDPSAVTALARKMVLEIAGFLGYPEGAVDLSGIEEGMSLVPEAWEHFITALRFADTDNAKEEFYLGALKADPAFAIVYVNLARLYLAQGRAEKALSLLEAGHGLLQGDPVDNDIMNLMAFCWLRQGSPERALEIWKKVVEDDPDRADAWHNLGNLYRSLGERDKALACYRRSVQADGLFPLARFGLGRLLAEIGNYREAMREIRIYMELVQGDPWAYSILGRCLLETGEREAARFALGKAVQLDPGGEAGMLARQDLEKL